MNKVILIGNVGKDPEIKAVGTSKVANFSLATTENYKNKNGEKVTNTEWHNIVIWGKLADVVESYVKKGAKLVLEGKITTRSYEVEGVKKYVTDINCNNMTMLGSSNNSSTSSHSPSLNDGVSDDLPF